MVTHFWLIVLIALVCGSVGGARNFLLISEKNRDRDVLLRSLIEANAAAMLVPLFLSIIGNDIVEIILSGSPGTRAWLYAIAKLLGFCILASFYSNRFLSDLSNRVLKVENDTQTLKKEVSQIEPAVIEGQESQPRAEQATAAREAVSGDLATILKAFLSSSVPARSVEGLALSTGIDEERLIPLLDDLVSRKLVQRIETSRGYRWILTTAGQIVATRPP
jgi:hypothetical protein